MDILAQKRYKILLIGDNCNDIYVYGNITRLSPEAPVPVFQPTEEFNTPGMAGNVCKNLEALNCEVNFYHTETSEKRRLIDKRSKQHLIRIDHDAQCTSIKRFFIDVAELNSYDSVVISDYNKGTVSSLLIEWIREEYSGPVFIDTKKTDLAEFNGCYIKINQLEESLAKTLPNEEWLIVTRGENGADYLNKNFPCSTSGNVTDVCGAGDTFLAALTYGFLTTKSISKAIEFANKAAGITVQHVGVYAPKLKELLA